jgi:phospholipase C
VTKQKKRFLSLTLGIFLAGALVTCVASAEQETGESVAPDSRLDEAQKKIQHVVMIMQENRSFDNYFGTYPGADGLPRTEDGQFAVCLPDPHTGGCDIPYHNPALVNTGGRHSSIDAIVDTDGGKMDGFVATAEAHDRGCGLKYAKGICDPSTPPDVMGYHDDREIPNYWTYAQQFVLQDHMFQPDSSWSLPAHLFTVSGWSARCSRKDEPFSCQNDADLNDFTGYGPPMVGGGGKLSIPPTLRRCIRRQGVQIKGAEQPSPNDPSLPKGLQQCIDFAWTDLSFVQQ